MSFPSLDLRRRVCLPLACALTLLLHACGGGGDQQLPAATPNDGAPSAPVTPPSSPSSGSPDTTGRAPTVTIEMPVFYTPSQNMGLVFLQNGQERKIRYEDGVQVVSVVTGEPFEILIPGPIDYRLFTCLEMNSTYVAGQQIYIAGNVMARGYPWAENAEIGWDIRTGWFSRSYNTWYSDELPVTDKGYKVLKIKSVIHAETPPVDLDLLVYAPRSGSSYQTPGVSEYEFMKLRMLPPAPAAASAPSGT